MHSARSGIEPFRLGTCTPLQPPRYCHSRHPDRPVGTDTSTRPPPHDHCRDPRRSGLNSGSRGRVRTCDTPVNSRLLYHLSYAETWIFAIILPDRRARKETAPSGFRCDGTRTRDAPLSRPLFPAELHHRHPPSPPGRPGARQGRGNRRIRMSSHAGDPNCNPYGARGGI